MRRVEGGEVLYVTVYGHPKMELRSVTPSSWLDELMSTEPIDTGWLDEIEARREGEMALDWPTE